MERIVIVFGSAEELEIRNGYVQLFLDLANASCVCRFVGLEFSSWELPAALKVAVASLRRKESIAVLDDRRGNMYRLHKLPFIGVKYFKYRINWLFGAEERRHR